MALSERMSPAPAQPGSRPLRPSAQRSSVRLIQVGIPLVVLGVWQWRGSVDRALSLGVATPWAVMQWLASWIGGGPIPHGRGWFDLGVTLQVSASGYAIGVASGIVLGSLVGPSRWLRSFSAPFIAIANAFPKIALAPLFILVFGVSTAMQSYFVAVATFFITFFAVFNGIQSINPIYLRHILILGASRGWLVREVYVPAIFGWVMAGLRLTAAWALAGAVIVEYLASNTGIGAVVANGDATSDPAEVIGGLVIISFVALVFDRLLLVISRRFMHWRLV